MIAELGHYALVLALALGIVQACVPIYGARRNDPVLMAVAGPTAVAQFAFVALAFAALVACYVRSDFAVVNVFENSHSLKPLIYKISGVWGNHEGSMLLWVLILSVFGALVAIFGGNLPASLRANVLGVQSWIATAFYLFILVTSNPFLRIADAPLEGRDLNPILQDVGLAIHPPLLYLGYVGFSISFTFASDPTRGVFILMILVMFIGGGLALFAWRAPLLKQGGLFAPVSREGALVLNNLFLVTACATVFVGTLYPLALEAITGEKISVGAPFFNSTFGPLFIPLMLAMPFGPLMAWKRGDLPGVAQRLTGAAAI